MNEGRKAKEDAEGTWSLEQGGKASGLEYLAAN